jgi:hypothetical protein
MHKWPVIPIAWDLVTEQTRRRGVEGRWCEITQSPRRQGYGAVKLQQQPVAVSCKQRDHSIEQSIKLPLCQL